MSTGERSSFVKGDEMAKFVDRLLASRVSIDDEAVGTRRTESAAAAENDNPNTPGGSSMPRSESDHGTAGQAFAAAAPDQTYENGDYGNIGEHVASVLESARAAAERIREDAREDARRVGERAQKDAADVVERARREAEEAENEAQRIRAEADAAATEQLQAADRYAAEVRAASEKEAAAVVMRAKEQAQEHTRDAQTRSVDLDNNIKRAEERLSQVVGGLRDVAGRLEGLITDTAPSAEHVDEPASAGKDLDRSLQTSAVQRGAGEATR
jgi:F0F1-type ATP synthase membrane subunit b/b'